MKKKQKIIKFVPVKTLKSPFNHIKVLVISKYVAAFPKHKNAPNQRLNLNQITNLQKKK